MGPFQGQNDSPESNTQAGDSHPLVVDWVRDSPPSDSTGAPPGVSTVDLAVHTPVSRHRSDADMEALTQQMSDEAQFQEERARMTDAMWVTFLSKAKGAPPAVLEAWGILQPQEEASPPAQSTDAQPGQASQETELPKTAKSSGNRDVPSMKSRAKESSCGARRSRKLPPQKAHGFHDGKQKQVGGRSRDSPARRSPSRQSRDSPARHSSPRRPHSSPPRGQDRGRSPLKRSGLSRGQDWDRRGILIIIILKLLLRSFPINGSRVRNN